MTIPIQTPQIATTGVVQAPNPLEQIVSGYQVIALALQRRQELEQARQELAQRREQFELHKKIAGTQLAGMELDQEKKKRDMQAEEDRLAARTEALHLFTGSIPDLNTPEGIGRVIAKIKDPLVAAEFYTFLQDAQKVQGAVTPTYDIRPSADQYVGINPKHPTDTVRTGVPLPPDAASRRIPVVTEREKATAAIDASQANAIINQLEARDPDIGARVARRVATYRAGASAALKRLTGASPEEIALAAEAEIEKSMSADEQAFYHASRNYLGAIIPGIAGKQMTIREYLLQAPRFFSMGATTPEVGRNRRKARGTRIRGLMAEAGDAMAERMAELADPGEYGLRPVTLPDSTVIVPTPGRARFHPKFNVQADSTGRRP